MLVLPAVNLLQIKEDVIDFPPTMSNLAEGSTYQNGMIKKSIVNNVTQVIHMSTVQGVTFAYVLTSIFILRLSHSYI